ncbi:MAG TPA: radical SAM protein [Spirochaetota bacterium]|nr:radical SAM protein [Spirochaetota bacterium]
MSLKVLLVSPPIFDFYYSFHRSEPLGLLYIKEALAHYDWLTVTIFDARYKGTSKVITTPEVFNYLHHLYVKDTSWFSLFHGFKRFGYSYNTIVTYIKENEYDVVCITSLFSAYHHDVEVLVERIKNETGAIVIVGGWAVWADTNILVNGRADFYIRGDGELTLPILLQEIYSSNGNISHLPKLIDSDNSSVNEFFMHTFPHRETWYTYYGKRIANIICSKGCVYHCDFCSIHSRYRYYQRTIDSIQQELEYLYAHGVKIVNFEDDNFLFNRKFAKQLLSLMKYYHNKGMYFLCMNGVTAPNLYAVFDDALDAGFLEFNLSLVSSYEEVVKQHNRPALQEIIKDIAWKSAGNVRVIVYIIAGLPGATVKTCIDDILFLASLPVMIGFSPLYMLPGVRLFESMGVPDDRRLCRGSALYSFGEGFSRVDIAALWKLCRFINRLKIADAINDEVRVHYEFYKKACNDHVWHYRDEKGLWHEGFSFSASLPESFHICDINGRTRLIG